MLITCGIQELNAQTCVTHSYSDNRSYPDQNPDRYKLQENFLPAPTDCVKTLRINLHVMQYKVGDERNFLNDSAHNAFLEGLIDYINIGYSELKVPSHPQTCVCSNDCYIKDTRLRLELQKIYFHVDSIYYNSTSGTTLLSQYPMNNSTEYNYYIVGPDIWKTGGSVNKFPSYSSFGLEQANIGQGYHYQYIVGDTSNNLGFHSKLIVKHMIHEIGHAYGLHHLYKGHELTDTSRDDYLVDFYGTGTTSCLFRKFGAFETCNENPPSDTCVSNWMGGNVTNPLHRELTPLQIGRLHRATMLSSMRKYFKPSANHVSDHEITTNETWDFNIRMYGDIVVKSGATLTIRCKVLMPPEGEIRVEPNGRLIVDGGTITSTEDGPNNWWQGIIARGTDGISQYDTSSTFGYGHGHVIIKNNALIENAISAISTHTIYGFLVGGGVIEASNSTSRNNVFSVRMGKFEDVGAHKNKKNRSDFNNCTFEWDTTYLDKNRYIRSAMELVEVKEVNIDSCIFINKSPAFFPYNINDGIGITAIDASAIIKNCEFDDLYKGVHVGMVVCSAPTNIQYNTFTSCYFGILVYKSEFTTIQQNKFYSNQMGIRLAETKGFKVSENEIWNGTYGIENWNLLYHSNELYNNLFSNLNTGISAQGYASKSNSGLSMKCNFFAPSGVRYRDVSVTTGSIDSVQGSCDYSSPNRFSLPSGNEFSHKCNNGYSDFYAYFHPSKIEYNHHYQFLTGPYKPSCITSYKVINRPCATTYDILLSCPDSTFKQTTSGSQWLSQSTGVSDHYRYQKHEFEVAEYDFALLIDGGNTTARTDYIDPISGYTSDDIKTEMISYSPYLSEAVLNACINRSPSLVDNDLFQILVANSPLSIELADALEGMTAVLTAPQIANLVAVQGGISKRDSVQNDVRWNKQQTELALNELLRLFALDSNADNPTDSMIYYLEDWDTPESKELLVPLYWQKEDFTKAQDAIDDIEGEEGNEHLDYVLQKLQDVLNNGDSLPVLLGDTLVLDSIALDSTKAGQAWAQNLMYRLTGKLYSVFLPDTSDPASIMAEPEITTLAIQEELKNTNIQVFPNPNKGKFVIEFKGIAAKHIIVYSIQGKEVYKKDIGKQTQLEVNLPKNLSGIFQLVIYGKSNQVIHTEKLIINE